MTISSTSNKAQFSGSGTTGPFPFTFKVFDSGDLDIIKTVAGIDTTLTITTHYTVSLNADQNNNPGGSVTLVSSLAVGETLTILRTVDATQETDIANGGGFYPEVIENALDRVTMLCQQNSEKIARAVVAGVTDDPQVFIDSIFAAEASAVASASSAGASATAADASADAAAASAASLKTSDTGSLVTPSGTTGQRDGTPVLGYFRYNTTLSQFEGYGASGWGAIGGGGGQMLGAATTKCLSYNAQTIDEDLTVASGTNAYAAGPITINTGRTVTVSDGCVLTVI